MTDASQLLRTLRITALPIVTAIITALLMNGQAPSKPPVPQPEKDTLLFQDGEKLVGTLKRSTGTSVVFHSDMAGDVTVDWSKIKELNSYQKFAVVPKGVNLAKEENADKIPQGTVVIADNKVELKPASDAAPLTFSGSDTADVIDAATFDRAVLRKPRWYAHWRGAATVGLSLVEATQQSRNYTSNVSLVRAIPGEDWMNPENRTSFNFSSAYGKLLQPGSPELKTSIFHAEAERDRYLSPRLFLFAEAAFAHDYSQGLDLQQTFGFGLGWTVRKTANQQLDVKAQIAYVDQMFSASTTNQHLLSSVFSESYNRQFPKKVLLHEDVSVSPAWTNLRAYSATGNLSLTVPVIKRIAFTMGILDTFLNDPSPGFRKNSFQFTSGITYVIP